MAGARVVVEHVSRAYGQAIVLDDVSFAVEPGELVALAGPSGSGKTTLLQLIGSLDRPTEGSIRVDDIEVENLAHPARFRRDIVGFVFQLHHLLPALSVQQNVELPMLAARAPRHERAARSRDLLDEVGLGDRARALPSDLSGGERQRVAIARALAGWPRLVLADEPTGALDSVASHRIWELLEELRARRGTTVIVASHDPSLTEHADRALHLADGRLTSPVETQTREGARVTSVAQALTSLRRRPGRTFLTALGTALGIATIVALLAVADGARHSAGDFLHLGASDLGLFQKDAADPTTSVLPTSMIPELKRTPGIADATPLVLLVSDLAKSPGAIVFGADAQGFLTNRLVFSSGRMYRSDHEIVFGDAFARQMHTRIGDIVKVSRTPLRVVGIYHIGVQYQDSGAFVPLSVAQAIGGRPNEATTIPIKLGVGTSPAAAEKIIGRRFPGILVIADAEEATRAGANGQLISKAALVIAALALLIGGIGVMNTMLMAVIERRSEFALLSAVGWSGPQIARRVLVEGVVTTIVGAVMGLLVGVIGARLLVDALGAKEFVSPQVTAWGLGRALLVGVLIGVLGGLYPAWRAAHVSPAHVLAQG